MEAAHSWFTHFRKLLVRYETLDRSFLGLNHLVAAIIAFRKVHVSLNIIYGEALSIGMGKTGSSSIQAFLSSHRSDDLRFFCVHLSAMGQKGKGDATQASKWRKSHGNQ